MVLKVLSVAWLVYVTFCVGWYWSKFVNMQEDIDNLKKEVRSGRQTDAE